MNLELVYSNDMYSCTMYHVMNLLTDYQLSVCIVYMYISGTVCVHVHDTHVICLLFLFLLLGSSIAWRAGHSCGLW